MTEPQPYERRPFTFDRTVRILFTVCTLVAVLFLLNLLKGVLLPFLVACLIAYMLEPIVGWNMRWMHTSRRFFPVFLTLIEFIVVVVGLGYLFVPYLVAETTDMAEMLRKYASTQINIPYLSSEIHNYIRHNLDFDQIARFLTREQWIALAKKTVSSGWSVFSSSVSFIVGVLSWLVVILYVIFIMLDYERLMLSFRQLVPPQHRRSVFRVFNDIKVAMNRYFRGQFVIAFCVGILFSVGFLLIKLPMAVVLGMFIGMLNLVPYLQLISLPVTALLCLVGSVGTGMEFWTLFWESMAVYVVVQAIQDLILTPKIMGKAMGLNPAIILLSLSVWGALLGFMGLIIALPLTTLVLSYYDRYVVQRVQYKAMKRKESQ